jgi:hypothetical protein
LLAALRADTRKKTTQAQQAAYDDLSQVEGTE